MIIVIISCSVVLWAIDVPAALCGLKRVTFTHLCSVIMWASYIMMAIEENTGHVPIFFLYFSLSPPVLRCIMIPAFPQFYGALEVWTTMFLLWYTSSQISPIWSQTVRYIQYISLHQPDTSISITCPCIFFLTLFIHLFVCSKNSFNVLLCYRGYQHLKCVLWTNGWHFVIWSNNCTFNKAHCRKIL